MFGSPTEWCSVCRAWVALDVSRAECAREHRCIARQCPIARYLRKDPPPQPVLAAPSQPAAPRSTA